MKDKSKKITNLGLEKQADKIVVPNATPDEIIKIKQETDRSHDRVETIGLLEEPEKEKDHLKSKEDKDDNLDKPISLTDKHKSTLYFERGFYKIPESDKEELKTKIEEICVGEYAKMGAFSKKAASLLKGHSVASEKDYKCGTASFSTRTSLIEIGENKYFVIYNYPGSNSHRKPDTNCRKAWGEKALKASEETWRDTFVARSLIPAHKAENPRVVVLPFIPNISLIDLIERFNPDNFQGDYSYGKKFDNFDSRVNLIKDVAASLGELHSKGVTWGEVIAANIGLTPDGKILFFDPETPYIEGTSDLEKKARDLLSWCTSACTALSKSNKKDNRETDYKVIIEAILEAFPDQKVIKFLKENLCEELKIEKTLRHPIAFGQFKARLAVNSRKQYNEILHAIKG